MTNDLVLGVDSGGTSTRCCVATLDGRIVGVGRGPGANVRSSAGDPAESVAVALRATLTGLDPARVRAAVAGVAGSGRAGQERAEAALSAAAGAVGLPITPRLVPDIAVAFAAGSPDPSGVVLVAGTGAVAAHVTGERVDRRADGHGWLLGDEGSGAWLGLRAARAVLRAHDGRGPRTSLTAPVLAALGIDASGLGGDADIEQEIIAVTDRMRPASLAALAPLVSAAADAGDQVAGELARRAADALLTTLDAVLARAGHNIQVVVAGSVLTSPGPVGVRVRAGIIERTGRAPGVAGRGEGGAAALALRGLGHPVTAAIHTRLTR